MSRTVGRSCSGSMSTARKAMPAHADCAAMSRAWVRARTSTTMRQSGCRSVAARDHVGDRHRLPRRACAKPRNADAGVQRLQLARVGTAASLGRNAMAPRSRSSTRGKMRAKQLVDPIHQRAARSENCCCKRCTSKRTLADSLLGEFQERAHLRLAKSINRLHRIADTKHAASIALLPAGRQQPHQFELCARGVLKLVHQDVLQTIVEPQSEIGRRIGRCRARAARPSTRRENRPHPARETPGPTLPPRAPDTCATSRTRAHCVVAVGRAPAARESRQEPRSTADRARNSSSRSVIGDVVRALRREALVLGESLAQRRLPLVKQQPRSAAPAREIGTRGAQRGIGRPATRPVPAAPRACAARRRASAPTGGDSLPRPSASAGARSARDTSSCKILIEVLAHPFELRLIDALAACRRPASSGSQRSRLGSMSAISLTRLLQR